MGSPPWFVRLAFQLFKKSILIARLSNAPLIGRLMDRILFLGDDITYLPRDQTIVVNKKLDARDDMVLPSQILSKLIEKAEYIFKMNSCPCRTNLQCQDYPRDLGCLFLGDAAKHISPFLGKPISKSEAHNHLEKCREAGLVHMTGRQRLDAIWLNAWPVEQLLSICNCCPCCCLWRMTAVINPKTGRKIKRMPGLRVEVTDVCIGCETCYQNGCFVNAIKMIDGRAVITDDCRGCGRCAEVCPENAIKLEIESSNAYADTLSHVSSLVDIS